MLFDLRKLAREMITCCPTENHEVHSDGNAFAESIRKTALEALRTCTRRQKALATAVVLVLVFGAALLVPATAFAYDPWNYDYTWDEVILLARLVYAEADGEPYVGKVAVAAVVLNRVRSPLFPDTIAEVIYEPWQFSCVGNWMFNSYPPESAIQAALDALNGWDPTGGALYYFNYTQVWNPWLWSRPCATVIGQHWFAY
ncbi:MAG: cell wall hydrolase [Firmicutes bacterium]|nr:cell wall hydrolase [Candidatus Fermentithermobacillaceae bacterium]